MKSVLGIRRGCRKADTTETVFHSFSLCTGGHELEVYDSRKGVKHDIAAANAKVGQVVRISYLDGAEPVDEGACMSYVRDDDGNHVLDENGAEVMQPRANGSRKLRIAAALVKLSPVSTAEADPDSLY